MEYGRIAETLHLLRVVDLPDGTYQRRTNRQPTIQEPRYELARDDCHGWRGQIMPAYRESQTDQLCALGSILTGLACGDGESQSPCSAVRGEVDLGAQPASGASECVIGGLAGACRPLFLRAPAAC